MAKLRPGLYEQLINNQLAENLESLPDRYSFESGEVDKAEMPKVLAGYAAQLIEAALTELADGGRTSDEEDLINNVVGTLGSYIDRDTQEAGLDSAHAPRQLLEVTDLRNSAAAVTSDTQKGQDSQRSFRPQTSIATSSLFTGSPAEPQLMTEIKKEILTSDRVDLLVSFIKWNGLRQIIGALKEFTDNGGHLRVITTTYMGATDFAAVERLRSLKNTEVKISFDAGRARMHAKAYIFIRDTGFTTAYVGSSNISVPALTSGLEWNVKVGHDDQPDILNKIQATFESYWADVTDFVTYDETQRERLRQELDHAGMHSDDAGAGSAYSFDIHPYAFQQAILDQLQAEREIRGHARNLVVAATGTGKTVISAFDYRRVAEANGGTAHTKLLFVAHREEILKQALACYRGVLKDPNFGDLFVGTYEPSQLKHLFVSIQTFNSRDLAAHVDSDYYDYIVVDEFHHAAAASYQRLLEHFKPKVLLGLTGTPERLDGKDVTSYFGGRIAAEIRLPEAIERKLLCPFQYFGVADTVDLSELRWSRGGYEKSQLDNVYVFSREKAAERAGHVVDSLREYVADIDSMKALGFCVSIAHAKFMADQFNARGIPSLALSGENSEHDRTSARSRLVSGEIKAVFVVDLYNEGIDIPQINTILFLRPTESLTIFLQQLGRGLRNCEGKDCLTVLDFVGRANQHYDFASKFEALLTRNRSGIRKEIEEGFPSVPKGCYIQLERKAQEYVLRNISRAVATKKAIISRIETFETDTGEKPNLRHFIEHYQLDPRAIYKTGSSFSRLCVSTDIAADFDEKIEADLTRAFPRIAMIDSRRWLRFLIKLFSPKEPLLAETFQELPTLQKAWVDMFQVTIWRRSFESDEFSQRFSSSVDWINEIRASTVMKRELLDLLAIDLDHIDFIDEPITIPAARKDGSDFECPLDLHCRYTRDQILVALGFMKPTTSREGVKWLGDIKTDILFNTLNKSEKDYSPSTMYQDYSVNETLFHWQSQSTTSEGSATGQRYIHQDELGTHVLLFVRDYDKDAFNFTMPLTFLGLAHYVSHEGSRPMNILWRLEKPIPARFLSKTQKLIA